MEVVADLHLHSKFSRAVSQQMTLPVMARYAQQKGLDILTASDFTHPLWFKEISNLLEEDGEGMYILRDQREEKDKGEKRETHFLLSTEIASIYKQGDKLRRIHNLVFAPNLETAGKIIAALVKLGANLNADGRPIIGLSSRKLLELIMEVDQRCFIIPCHAWTPHFGVYGSASGFDPLEEAFGDMAQYIYGIETGISSDPDMNWSIPELKNRSILSFSDAHSPAKMGREATVFELDGETPTYEAVRQAIMRPSQLSEENKKTENGQLKTDNRIVYTIEFYPEEGKYHFSGHRNCKVSFGPEDIKEKGTVCPVCHKRLTEGVLVRVQQLADSALIGRAEKKQNESGLLWHTDKKKTQPPYLKLVPLLEIVAKSMNSTVASQKVQALFATLCAKLGSEMAVLLRSPLGDIEKVGGSRVAEGVKRVREGNIIVDPGYDGEYGKVEIWTEGEEEKKETNRQRNRAQLSMDF